MIPYNKTLKQRARELRGGMTDAERKLWSKIRRKQIHDLQFYRQKPVGNYIVDFYCPSAKLIIEVDGAQHYQSDQWEYDRVRDAFLKGLGFEVLRFSNLDVLRNVEGVTEKIMDKVGESPSIPPGDGNPPIIPPEPSSGQALYKGG
jgi:very-short-patch-repair endonuclease